MTVPNDSAKILTMVERVSRAKGWWDINRNGHVLERWYIDNSDKGPGFDIAHEAVLWWDPVDPLTALLWALLACLDDVEGEPARLLLDAHEDRNDARDRLTVLADHWAGGEVTTTVAVDVPERDRVCIESRNLAPMAAWITAWLDGWRGETRALFEAEMMAAANEVWERITVVCPKTGWHEARAWQPHAPECSTCDGHGRVPEDSFARALRKLAAPWLDRQPEDPEWFGVIDDVEVTFTRRELMVLRVGDGIGNLVARVDGVERSMDHETFQLEQDSARAIDGIQRVTVTLRSLRTGDTSELRAAWRV